MARKTQILDDFGEPSTLCVPFQEVGVPSQPDGACFCPVLEMAQ
jgi:hypothetical protein